MKPASGQAFVQWFDDAADPWESCCDSQGRVLWVIPPGFDRRAFFTPMLRGEVLRGTPVFIAFGVSRAVAMDGAGHMWGEWRREHPE